MVVTSTTWWVNLFYSILNGVLGPLIGLYVLYVGFYGVMKRPKSQLHLVLFWVCEGILLLMWFVFMIWNVGPWNGFVKIKDMNDYTEKNTGFQVFLICVESIIHIILMAIGGGLIAASVFLSKKNPTAAAEQDEAGVDSSSGGFGQNQV